MDERASYGQFCPISMASEILCSRWTTLVLRELLCGSTRFNDLRRGVPKMSPGGSSSAPRVSERDGHRASGVKRRQARNGKAAPQFAHKPFTLNSEPMEHNPRKCSEAWRLPHGLTHSVRRRDRRHRWRGDARSLQRPLTRLHSPLALTRATCRRRRRPVRLVAWRLARRLARWMARRLASWMGLASGMAWRLAWRMGTPLRLRAGLALLVDPVGRPPLRMGLRRDRG